MSVDNSNSNTPQSEKDLAQTPKWFIRSLESLIGRKFDLDVCAAKDTAKADNYFSIDDGVNALTRDWIVDGKDNVLAWCNPPFTNITAFIDKAVEQCNEYNVTIAMIIPNNPEVSYRRYLKSVSDHFIEMPFRLKFLRPNGDQFKNGNGKENSPKFSCAVGIITPIGLHAETRVMEWDFREGFYKRGDEL